MQKYKILEIILGPMFSGKTTELWNRIHSYSGRGDQTVYINYKKDNRETEIANEFVTSHNPGLGRAAETKCYKVIKLVEFEPFICDGMIIGIDESQFYSDLPIIINWLEKYEVRIICAGLDGDIDQKPFGHLLQMTTQCNSIDKLLAKCSLCDSVFKSEGISKIEVPAPFTYYHPNYQPSEKKQEDIGGKDKFIAVCRLHLNQLKTQRENQEQIKEHITSLKRITYNERNPGLKQVRKGREKKARTFA